MEFEFLKVHGLGNDFIIMDDRKGKIKARSDYPRLAEKLCSRNFGIGADGLVFILDSVDHDIKFKVFNSDGSEAQMCGNAIRCFAKYLYENKIVDKRKIRVETMAGTIVPEVITDSKDMVHSTRVDMGEPVLLCSDVPFISENKHSVEESLQVNGRAYKITAVGMGNPHGVIFVDDISSVDVNNIGPAIENHERFPEKTNVEFVQVLSSKKLRMRVWERGAGITLACGTGACASLVAANLAGKTGEKVVVQLDGGDLEIEWDKSSNHIFKTGPATEVFKGQIKI